MLNRFAGGCGLRLMLEGREAGLPFLRWHREVPAAFFFSLGEGGLCKQYEGTLCAGRFLHDVMCILIRRGPG